jgi:hypothetical protein
LTLLGADAAHVFQLLLYMADAAVDFSAIGFQLSFTGTARTDPATELRHFYAAAGQPRQHVLQLRQLYLQLAFPGARVPRKNIEDELSTIDHPSLHDSFNISLLRCGEIVIEEKKIGVDGCGGAGDFFKLSRADQSRRIGTIAALQNFADHFRARAARQRAQFG